MHSLNPLEVASETDVAAEKETGRVEAFSDGVFSIAMTLLVLELQVPKAPAGQTVNARFMLGALAHLWPSYLSFATSFFTVLTMWVNHHEIFRMIRRVDSGLLFANGFLLLLVTAVPFPTALVAQYLRTPAGATVCGVYSGLFVLISIGYTLLLTAALRHGGTLTVPPRADELRRRLRACYIIGTPSYIIATASAWCAPWLSIVICTILWIYWSWGRELEARARSLLGVGSLRSPEASGTA